MEDNKNTAPESVEKNYIKSIHKERFSIHAFQFFKINHRKTITRKINTPRARSHSLIYVVPLNPHKCVEQLLANGHWRCVL